jgi:hypothetical protein
VTLPEHTVTVPPSTETTHGETVVRPSEVVTVPATTKVVTGSTTATVATVTGPHDVVEAGSVATKRAVVTFTGPSRQVFKPPRVVHAEEEKLVVIVVHATACPPATAMYHGRCAPIVRGKD